MRAGDGDQKRTVINQMKSLAETGQANGATPQGQAAYKFGFMTSGELAKVQPKAWLIDKVIPEQSYSLIYGASGIGKSFTVEDMGWTLAQDKSVILCLSEGESRL